jgi:hypothetical protein
MIIIKLHLLLNKYIENTVSFNGKQSSKVQVTFNKTLLLLFPTQSVKSLTLFKKVNFGICKKDEMQMNYTCPQVYYFLYICFATKTVNSSALVQHISIEATTGLDFFHTIGLYCPCTALHAVQQAMLH